jgi:translation initiation factor IF-3
LKRIRFRNNQFRKPIVQDIYPVNERIKVPELRVIDENGQMIGILPTYKALAMAKERELDLIEVSPKAQPPVAKFLNYSTFKYQQEKAKRKQKAQQKIVETKVIRLSSRIGQHDIDIRLNQAEKFLQRGDKIALDILLKGRERQHPEVAREVMETFINNLKQKAEIQIEQDVKKMGNKFTALILPSSNSAKLDEKQ